MKHPDKYQALLDLLRSMGSVAVSFSGGVDSTFLAFAAHEALGDRAEAFTIDAPYVPRHEIRDAKAFAKKFGMKHHVIEVGIPSAIAHNPRNRCLLCKRNLFGHMQEQSREQGLALLIDGTNADDLKEDRPGLVALKELSVRSPLAELKISKAEIRTMAKKLGLEVWDKPSFACLLTRIPFDQLISAEDLDRIERAEKYLASLGFDSCRVRVHCDLVRIEVPAHQRADLVENDMSKKIAKRFKELGFSYVTVDILGYRLGSMGEAP